MTLKQQAHTLIDAMGEDELRAWIVLIGKREATTQKETAPDHDCLLLYRRKQEQSANAVEDLAGVLRHYATPEKLAGEKEALNNAFVQAALRKIEDVEHDTD